MPEIEKLMPLDAQLDKIQVQKAATPVPVHQTLDEVALAMAADKPNGVVLEKSSYDDADINASRIPALQLLSRKLGEEPEASESCGEEDSSSDASESEKEHTESSATGKRLQAVAAERKKVASFAVHTGNAMMDQFEPWYFGVAFAFLFKYCTGMPDLPSFSRKPRFKETARPEWKRMLGSELWRGESRRSWRGIGTLAS